VSTRQSSAKGTHSRCRLIGFYFTDVEVLDEVCGCIRDEFEFGSANDSRLPLRVTAEDAKVRAREA